MATSTEVEAQKQAWLSLTSHDPPSGSAGASAHGSPPEELDIVLPAPPIPACRLVWQAEASPMQRIKLHIHAVLTPRSSARTAPHWKTGRLAAWSQEGSDKHVA